MSNPNTVSGGGSGNYKINANYNNRVSNNVIDRKNYKLSDVNNGKLESEKIVDEYIFDDVITNEKLTVEEITEIANDVINGKYGSGENRKKQLEDLGYDYKLIQSKVNDIILGTSSFNKLYDEYVSNISNEIQDNIVIEKETLENKEFKGENKSLDNIVIEEEKQIANNNFRNKRVIFSFNDNEDDTLEKSLTTPNLNKKNTFKNVEDIIPGVILENVNQVQENIDDFAEINNNLQNAQNILNNYLDLKNNYTVDKIHSTYDNNIDKINNIINNKNGDYYEYLFSQETDSGKILGIFGSKKTVIGLGNESAEYYDYEVSSDGTIKYYSSSSHNSVVKEIGLNYVKVNNVSYKILDFLNIDYSSHHQFCPITYYKNGCFSVENFDDIYYFDNNSKLLKKENDNIVTYYLDDGSILSIEKKDDFTPYNIVINDGTVLSDFNSETSSFCKIEDSNYKTFFKEGKYSSKNNMIFSKNDSGQISFDDQYAIKKVTLENGKSYSNNSSFSQLSIYNTDGSYKHFYLDGSLSLTGCKDYYIIYDHESGHMKSYDDHTGKLPNISYWNNHYEIKNNDNREMYFDNGEYKIEYSNGEYYHYNPDGSIKFARKILSDGTKENYQDGKLCYIDKPDGTHISYFDDGTRVISYKDGRPPEVFTDGN